MEICYDQGLLRNSLYLINKNLGIGFSEILEEWDRWMRKEHNKPFLDKKLIKFIQGDRLTFLKNRRIKEEKI